jgi:lantibiotic leader peptide-processing serine protease
MRKAAVGIAAAMFAVAVPAVAASIGPIRGAAGEPSSTAREFLVLYQEGASPTEARAAIAAAGGSIVRENTAIGLATVRTRNQAFGEQAARRSAIAGTARNRSIGRSPPLLRPKIDELQRLNRERRAARGRPAAITQRASSQAEPLSSLQWGNEILGATADGSYAVQTGKRKVLVGIIDTGIDARHPDLRRNFHKELSRNFTRDIPRVDGPCRKERDTSCDDPPNVDEHGHGSHVAGIVAAQLNDLGIGGIAPNVKLVNLRAGQDSGYFFLQETVDALTYAADNGVDVVNMSFYIDPWLYNCPNNPADSPAAKEQQQVIIAATQAAVDYALDRGVTLVGSLGNSHTDLGNPKFDDTSPDFPPGSEYERTVDNTCLDLPVEAEGVIGVSAVGPSLRKAYYSNYGIEQTDLAAPGGDFFDLFGTEGHRTPGNLVLSAYPLRVAKAAFEVRVDKKRNRLRSLSPYVVVDCKGPRATRKCAAYQFLEGTSMASPHVTGVAALIISQFGTETEDGVGMDPAEVFNRLKATASKRDCPDPSTFIYPGLPPEYDAACETGTESNGGYGYGVVDALNAVIAP